MVPAAGDVVAHRVKDGFDADVSKKTEISIRKNPLKKH